MLIMGVSVRFIYGSRRYPDHTRPKGRMIGELERTWKEVVVALLKYYSNIYFEELKKTAEK
jgi:hypothetical protein